MDGRMDLGFDVEFSWLMPALELGIQGGFSWEHSGVSWEPGGPHWERVGVTTGASPLSRTPPCVGRRELLQEKFLKEFSLRWRQ